MTGLPKPDLDLSKALTGPWTPVRHTLGYRISVSLVAAAMVCLPIIYFAIIALAGYLVFLHLTHNTDWFSVRAGGRGMLFIAIAYLGPAIIGIVVILFMLKPMFAPPARREPGLTLEPFEEQRLYGFVHMICDLIGAPKPRSIEVSTDVNASAALRRGWLSLVLPGDLVLSIGTPLVAGLSVQQFAGILAHEFGHFAQGSGMRAGFLIHSIMKWFARAAYERDAWDEQLAQLAQDGGHWSISLVAALARLCVGLTRLILIGLLWIARVLGAVMSRQMEFDADRYEARLAGSKAYEYNATRIYALARAYGIADSEAAEMYRRSKELPDDFASLVADAAERLDPETLDALAKRATVDNTGLFDTHPSTAARIKAARALEEPGVFHCDLPARLLFTDFHAASVKASYGHYQARLGRDLYQTTFIKAADVLTARTAQRTRESGAERYLGFRPPTWRPLFLSIAALAAPSDPKAAVAWIKAARAKLASMSEDLSGHARDYRLATEQRLAAHQAKFVFGMGFRVLPRDMGLKYLSPRAADEDTHACNAKAAMSAAALDQALELADGRISRCLRLLCVSGVEKRLPDAPARRARVQKLLKALGALKAIDPTVQGLREDMRCLSALQYAFTSKDRIELGRKKLNALADSIRKKLHEINHAASPIQHPCNQPHDITSLAEKLMGPTHGMTNLDEVFGAAYAAIEKFPQEHARILGEIVENAEAIEKAIGVTPSPAPVTA
jgi:Zn-dependent protease with chaperone function